MTTETDSIEWLDLDTDEAIRWTGRPGAYPLAPFLVIGVGIALFGVFLAALLTAPSSPLRFVLIGLFIGLGLFVAGWRSAEHRSVAYAITTDAVYEKRGSADADVSRTPLDAIESVSAEQSTVAGVLGRGTVRCYAPRADRTTLTLEGISDPDDVSSLLAPREPTGLDRSEGDPARTGPDPRSNPTGSGSGTIATDLDTTDGGSDVDRSDGAENALGAYVVDATDHAVLLRAFTDVSTVGLERGRRVSITIRSDLDGDFSPESRRTPALDSLAPDSSLEPGHGSDAGPSLEPAADRRLDPERTDETDGTDETDETDGTDETDETDGTNEDNEDQFVWGSTSAGDGTAPDDGEDSETDSDRTADDRS